MSQIKLLDTKRTGRFEWQWPEGEPEQFGEAWDASAVTTDRSFRIRVGLGSRDVYGKRRAHVVVWPRLGDRTDMVPSGGAGVLRLHSQ